MKLINAMFVAVPKAVIPVYIFFDNKHILISRRYQLHLVSATMQCTSNMDTHRKQKGKITKRKVPL
jgi:hypothetical protein